MNNYKTGYCFNTRELYDPINPAKWNITMDFAKEQGFSSHRSLCGHVLCYLLYLIILDIIENNVTFELPLVGNKEARIYVKCFQDDDFMRMYAGGKFLGIDFIASEYKGYQIHYQWKRGHFYKEKPIYISHTIKDWFYYKINKGKQYY